MTKHTPGPVVENIKWEMDGRYFNAGEPGSQEEYDRLTALHAENQANARLIAAAPDLLEACADLVQLWQDWAKDSQSLAQPLKRSIEMRVEDARAAIAKAEGRE